MTRQGLPPAWNERGHAEDALAGSELLELVEADLLAGWHEARQWQPKTLLGRTPDVRQHPAMVRAINTELTRLREQFHAGRLPT